MNALLVLDRLLPLPPYSPELNPVENLWRHLRQRHLSNRCYANLDDLDDAKGKAWVNFIQDPAAVTSQCNYHWLTSETN